MITKETSKKITFTQVIFTIMVVYIHAYNLDIYAITNAGGISSVCYYLERIMYYVTAVAVPGFFFLSGYLFYATLIKENILKKYRSRLFSLVIPYIIWNIVGYLFWIVLENIPAIAQKLSTQHLWTLSLGSLGYAFILPVNSPLWFMRNLFAVLLLAVPVWFVVKKKWGIIPLAGLLVVSILIRADKYNLVYDLFLFALGGYVSLHINHLFQNDTNKTVRLISIGVLVSYIIISILLPEINLNKYGLQLPIDTLLFASVWFCINRFEKSTIMVTDHISDKRTFIYFSHSILLESMEKLFFILTGKGVAYALVDYVVMPIITVTILVFVGGFLKKHFPKIWKILNGYR